MTIRTTLCAAAFLIGISQPVLASDARTLAEKYVKMPETQKMISDMFAPETMANQIASSLPPHVKMTSDQKQRVGILMSNAMNELRPRLESQMIEGSAKIFSTEELQALIDFYSSKHGAAVMSKMQPFMQNTMAELAPEIQRLQEKLTPELTKIFQETN